MTARGTSPLDQRRDYSLLETTVALCPECLARLEGKIFECDGQVFVSRTCPKHGPQLDLLEEDRDYFIERNQFARPATVTPPQTAVEKQCPFDCGLCPNHQQHTCIALIEITNACDLRCAVCYAESGGNAFLSADEFERMLDFAVAAEGGNLDILQLSGGEPTLHPELEKLIRIARTKGVRYVLLNTNGLNLARRPELVECLSQFREGFEVYLQFDSLSDGPQAPLRGRGQCEIKQQALANLAAYRVPTTLVATVTAGVNDHELGGLIVKALETPFVRGVSFQPLAYFGRLPVPLRERTRRVTLSGVLRRVEAQMKQMIRAEHFAPLPCDVDRVAIAYFYKNREGSIRPILTRREALAHLPQFRNTLRFTPEDFALNSSAPCGPGSSCCGGVGARLRTLLPKSLFEAVSTAEKARLVSESTFRITVSSFVDAYNFDLRSCQRECVHTITRDCRRIPFSAYNIYHRHHPVDPG